MNAPEMLRPAAAAARFGMSRQTLGEWADAGLIGRSRIGRAVWYVAADIADVIAGGLQARRIVPLTTSAPAASDYDWSQDPYWQKVPR